MQSKQIGHIDWVDGAKGVAIISVFLLHSLPCLREVGCLLHIGQAVPIFLFVSSYLASVHYMSFKQYYTISRIRTMFYRVFVPFAIILGVQVAVQCVSGDCRSWQSILAYGGIGPGSYYVWLYIQVWFLLPLIIELVNRIPIGLSLIVMLIVSVVCEYVFVLLEGVEHVEKIYRLVPVRYLMVLYAGCVWPQVIGKLKSLFIILAAISGVLMLLDVYNADYQCVITPPYWNGYHWFSGFYVLLLIILFQKISFPEMLKMAGKYSWQLFLLQMMCFGFN